MIAHFESVHIELWHVIEHRKLDNQLNKVANTSWTDAKKKGFFWTLKLKMLVVCPLWGKIYKGAQLQKCNTNVGHTSFNIWRIVTGEDVQAMFGCFQTILNELHCPNKTFGNYDNIDKILSLSKKWKPHMTTLRTVKNLNFMSIEELIRTLKVHEQKLQHDEGIKKGKSLALTT